MFKLFFDGGQRKTKISYGYVLYKDDEIIEKHGGEHDDPALSNNVAEYLGLIMGMTAALKHGAKELQIFGDSKLVIEQMMENYRAKATSMKPCFAIAMQISKSFDKITFQWIPRKENGLADREAR
jgi:ribonuclease H / adenosylcobalamin/alpha-ribazole phosphatase